MRTLLLGVAASLLVALGGACGSGSDTEATAFPRATEPPGDPSHSNQAATPTGATAPGATPLPTTVRRADPGPAEHVGTRTLGHIEQLSSGIGARVSGSDGEKKAVEYIADHFRALGYAVELMDFEVEGFGPARVAIAGDPTRLDASSLTGSATASFSGPAVFVGLGDSEGIAGRRLEGKVAVALRGTIRFSEKYANAEAAGARALVVLNNADGLFAGTLGTKATFPVVGVAGEQANRLRQAAESGAVISVEVASTARSVNVVARAVANERCRVLVGGHHDTVPGVPGATDNASGTAHTLELARAFAADGLDRGLCFATFGGEEEGLHGSRALAERWKAAGELPEYMVNLDVTATGTRIELIGEASLQDMAAGFAREVGAQARATGDPPNAGSDHMSFRSAGVPVIFLSTDDFSDIHTPRDAIDRVDPPVVEFLGDVAYLVIRELVGRVARP